MHASDSPHANRPLRPRKRVHLPLKIAAAILSPLLFLLVLEGVLRLAGYGYDPSPFHVEEGVVTPNWSFTYGFFPQSMARPMVPSRFEAKKPRNAFRVFVMGGSAAQGIPHPEYGLAEQLELQLAALLPEREIEVVNTAITATNSHAVREVAESALRFEPDALILYLGNNEVVGPFGPGTAFSAFNQSPAVIRLRVWLPRLKLYQLIENVSGANRGQTGTWLGMDMMLRNPVGQDDPRLESVYRNLAANLEAIAATSQPRKVSISLLNSTSSCACSASSSSVSIHSRPSSSEDWVAFSE